MSSGSGKWKRCVGKDSRKDNLAEWKVCAHVYSCIREGKSVAEVVRRGRGGEKRKFKIP